MNLFNVDFDRLVKLLLPVRLRKLVMLAWLKALLSPARWLYNLFTANREKNWYKIHHPGQLCYIRAALNDRFDPDQRRITISPAAVPQPVYLYRRPEQKPLFIRRRSESAPVALFTRDEIAAPGGFVIYVPSAIVFDMAEMKAFIDLYIQDGVRYEIVIT